MVFKPGVSGNPGGKRKERLFTEALRVELTHIHDEDYALPKGATNLQAIARKLVEQATKGNALAIKEVADRIEGKAEANLNVDHTGSITHEHEGVSDTLGWLGEIRGGIAASEAKKPVLN